MQGAPVRLFVTSYLMCIDSRYLTWPLGILAQAQASACDWVSTVLQQYRIAEGQHVEAM